MGHPSTYSGGTHAAHDAHRELQNAMVNSQNGRFRLFSEVAICEDGLESEDQRWYCDVSALSTCSLRGAIILQVLRSGFGHHRLWDWAITV